jgi:hypothetical protein
MRPCARRSAAPLATFALGKRGRRWSNGIECRYAPMRSVSMSRGRSR